MHKVKQSIQREELIKELNAALHILIVGSSAQLPQRPSQSDDTKNHSHALTLESPGVMELMHALEAILSFRMRGTHAVESVAQDIGARD